MHSFPLELLTVWWSLSILAEFRSLLNITTKYITSSHIVSLRIRLNLNLPSRTKQESSFSTQRSQSSCLLMENGIAYTPHLPPHLSQMLPEAKSVSRAKMHLSFVRLNSTRLLASCLSQFVLSVRNLHSLEYAVFFIHYLYFVGVRFIADVCKKSGYCFVQQEAVQVPLIISIGYNVKGSWMDLFIGQIFTNIFRSLLKGNASCADASFIVLRPGNP